MLHTLQKEDYDISMSQSNISKPLKSAETYAMEAA